MIRRVIPGTFFVGALLIVALLLTGTVRASRPAARVPNVRGHWDGFFLDGSSTVGLVRSDIAHQHERRVAGDGQLIDATTGGRLAAYNFGGTLGHDNVLTAAGKTSTGRVALQADLRFFAGNEGDAGVMDARLRFIPKRGQPAQVGAILLRPFPDKNAPDVSGDGAGVFRSQVDPTFAGDLALEILPPERNAFSGFVRFTPHSDLHAPFSWQSRATISDQGRLIVIAQGKTGRMIVDGAVLPGSAAAPSRAVDGLYTLVLNDGRSDFGFYNFSLTLRNP